MSENVFQATRARYVVSWKKVDSVTARDAPFHLDSSVPIMRRVFSIMAFTRLSGDSTTTT